MGNIKLPYSRCSLKPSNTQLSACAPPRPWASAKPFPCQTRLPCPQATYKDSRSGKSRRGASRPAPTRPTGRRSPHPTQEDGPDEDIRPNAEHSETRQHRGEDQRGEDLQEEDQGGEEGEQEEVSAVDGFFDGKAYRLVPTENGENTILINGVKMHISMSKRPSQDAEDKARLAKVRRGSTVLDVCCGLGYSAIACARLGAKRVISLEIDARVIDVARQNPLSAELFSSEAIQIVMGPAQETVRGLPDEAFSAVLHDPPRFSHAGELYSQAFYDQLFRVLKSGGRLFHYTGNPGSSVPRGAKERLLRAGFVSVKWIDTCQGLLAVKP